MKKKVKIIGIIISLIILSYISYNVYCELKLKFIMKDNNIYSINENNDSNLTISVKKGNEYASIEGGKIIRYIIVPQMAVWIEDTNGNFIKTIFVTPRVKKINREAALPVWEHRETSSTDAIASSTPKKSTDINIKKPDNLQTFNILLEVNKSYDNNKYYPMGKDYSGQPSLIYKATIDSQKDTYTMSIVGHGSPTGKDGLIYSDISNSTTSLNILEEVKITLK